ADNILKTCLMMLSPLTQFPVSASLFLAQLLRCGGGCVNLVHIPATLPHLLGGLKEPVIHPGSGYPPLVRHETTELIRCRKPCNKLREAWVIYLCCPLQADKKEFSALRAQAASLSRLLPLIFSLL
ncbi:hypothetical protein BaRGS_00032503, partial [Batillaria attramentaria]